MSVDLNKPMQIEVDKWRDVVAHIGPDGEFVCVAWHDSGGVLRFAVIETGSTGLRNTPEPPREVNYDAETWPAQWTRVRLNAWPAGAWSAILGVRCNGVIVMSTQSHQTLTWDDLRDYVATGDNGQTWHPCRRLVS